MTQFDLSLLSDDTAEVDMWDWMEVRTEPLSAADYLSFAALDLVDGKTPRHLVNALSNAKKALHLRLEDLCLGFGGVNPKSRRTFPDLIRYIRECGLVAPRVLDRLNAQRNAVEHDYILPTEPDVETFVDVAHLFVAATDRWVSRRPCQISCSGIEVTINSMKCNLIQITFDWHQGVVALNFKESKSIIRALSQRIECKSPSDDFFQYVRFAVRHSD
ncbi:hypothetical protein [Achromobacter sp. 2789STDY5608621]|uniref:hypothetical protein n=1 Tax=Achromobacter sp. 2789STDY5608621 TaxID=1806496 RepID=UPI0009E9BCCF|nr:hypothetical protein [Achromobacter sp. 2789STDY5608621]